jgi:hypothetical protein
MNGHVDEETSLLTENGKNQATTLPWSLDDEENSSLLPGNGKKQATPLPWSQLTIVMFLQLAEPLTANAISPFAPEVCSFFFTWQAG